MGVFILTDASCHPCTFIAYSSSTMAESRALAMKLAKRNGWGVLMG